MRKQLATAVFVIVLLPISQMDAANYTFHNVADTTGEFTFGPGKFSPIPAPQINNHGEVAFWASTDTAAGIFSGPDPTNDALVAPGTFVSPFGDFSMNDHGEIVFMGQTATSIGVFIARPSGSIDIVADDSGRYDFFWSPQINNNGDVAFIATLDEGRTRGIFTGADPSSDFIDTAAYSAGGHIGIEISMNNNGTVAFTAVLDFASGEQGIFTGPDPATDAYTDPSDRLAFFESHPSLNDDGVIAFVSYESPRGILIGPDPAADLVASGEFGFARINNNGIVAFSGPRGIFTAPSADDGMVIAPGDDLFGSKLAGFILGDINDVGQIVFDYSLENGLFGVAVATPVPEPSCFGLFLMATSLVAMRLRRRNVR